MGRSKPRYPNQLDNAFIDTCRKFQVDPFALEMMLIGEFVIAASAITGSDVYINSIHDLVLKAMLKYPMLPHFTVVVQGSLPVD